MYEIVKSMDRNGIDMMAKNRMECVEAIDISAVSSKSF